MRKEMISTASAECQLQPSLLLTGQFWHSEFADLVNGLTVPTTLVRQEQLLALDEWNDHFDMIVVCNERRGSVTQPVVDRLQALFPGKPIVSLLGSWCEGQSRSGEPLQGVEHVYWHQWHGSFEQLASLASSSSMPGAVVFAKNPVESNSLPGNLPTFAISALTLAQYELLADAIEALGGRSVWLENATWQAESFGDICGLLVDCESLTENLTRRVSLVQTLCPDKPTICVMGFPRNDEFTELRTHHRVAGIVSKPFELSHLYYSIQSATGIELPVKPKTVPTFPAISGSGHSQQSLSPSSQ